MKPHVRLARFMSSCVTGSSSKWGDSRVVNIMARGGCRFLWLLLEDRERPDRRVKVMPEKCGASSARMPPGTLS